jgi:hypothetical protein
MRWRIFSRERQRERSNRQISNLRSRKRRLG